MKNIEVINLVQAGFSNLNIKGLPAKEGLKVIRFTGNLDKTNRAIDEERMDIIKKTLGDRLDTFNAYQNWAQKKEGDLPEGAMTEEEHKAAMEEIVPLINELFMAEADIKLDPIGFEEFSKLIEQNEKLFTTQVINALEGILWWEDKTDE